MRSRTRRRPSSRKRAPQAASLRLAAIILFLTVAAAVTFLLACPPSVPVTAAPAAPAGVPAAPSQLPVTVTSRERGSIVPAHPRPEQGLLAVVIDDAGYSLQELQTFLDIPGPLTIAVLPNLPYSTEAARRIIAAGKDLILHLPMEPLGAENPGPGALYTWQSPAQVESLLAAAFASVPGAIGMNNHMGSRATADPALMTTVLGYLGRHGLFFLDSRTTAATVGPAIAQDLGVPVVQRDAFVDDDTAPADEAAAFSKGIDEAAAKGSAVVIGHVQNPSVAAILRARIGDLAKDGVRLARLVDVMALRGERGTR
jgi:polysaccharide deacetylase 2 family uncharacterized protein YibQ